MPTVYRCDVCDADATQKPIASKEWKLAIRPCNREIWQCGFAKGRWTEVETNEDEFKRKQVWEKAWRWIGWLIVISIAAWIWISS